MILTRKIASTLKLEKDIAYHTLFSNGILTQLLLMGAHKLLSLTQQAIQEIISLMQKKKI